MTRLSQLQRPEDFELEFRRESARERRARRHRQNLKAATTSIVVVAFGAAAVIAAIHGAVPFPVIQDLS